MVAMVVLGLGSTLGAMNPTAQLVAPEIRDLIAQERYRDLRGALRALEPADVAELLSELDPSDAAVAFRVLPRDWAGEVFSQLEPDVQEALIGELGEERALRLVESLDHDDRAALLDELPASVARRLMERLSPTNRRVAQQILGYPEESVGRLMTPDYVRVRQDWTVSRALAQVRRYGKDAESILWVFVVDDQGRLIDELSIRKLLLADPDTTIESLMDHRFVALRATDDREEAVRMMAHYDRAVLPVVDSEGVLLGIVTYDDIADVAEAEATEDIQLLAGVEALDRPYMQASLWELFRKRGMPLAVLILAESLAVTVLGRFEEKLAAVAALIAFIPLVIASGGNTGTQGATLLIRALSLGEIQAGDWWRILWRELVTAMGRGTLMGLIGFGEVLLFQHLGIVQAEHPVQVALAVGVSMFGVVLWAGILGTLVPMLAHKVGVDPATISSPLIATLMDISGLLIYVLCATLVLQEILAQHGVG